jgi:hypothetical protein
MLIHTFVWKRYEFILSSETIHTFCQKRYTGIHCYMPIHTFYKMSFTIILLDFPNHTFGLVPSYLLTHQDGSVTFHLFQYNSPQTSLAGIRDAVQDDTIEAIHNTGSIFTRRRSLPTPFLSYTRSQAMQMR